MCEQCSAKAILMNDGKEVLPDFFLVLATQDGNAMKTGDYGLVICNDPSFIFSMKPEVDPAPEDEDADLDDSFFEWLEKTKDFGKQFSDSMSQLKDAHKLVSACYTVGYTDECGSFDQWLFNYLAKFV